MLLLRGSEFLTRGFGLFITCKQELAMVVSPPFFSRTPTISRLLLVQQAGKAHRKSTCRCYSSSCSPPPCLSPSLASLISTCFSPSLGTLVDLSDYLKNGCNWQEAPSCPDYIGPVSIARTPDGRGRGLFASRNVEAGDILLISNAFAASYNDIHSIDLFTKIAEMVQRSPKALRQFYSLAGYDFHDDMEVPNVKLFDPNVAYRDCDPPANLDFDQKRIVHIMNVNSFEGELPSSANGKPDMRLTGLWLLPSFINHSCSPNSSRLVVGEAMFIIASCNIQENEEISISYTDSMSPLKKREDNLAAMGYGFRCECKRCMAERSVQHELKEYSECYLENYEKAADEVQAAATSTLRPRIENCPSCIELANVYDKLLKRLSSLSNLTTLEKQWILGGYSSAFLGKWLVSGYTSAFSPPSNFVNLNALELVEAMKATVPGLLRTLSFTAILAVVAEKDKEQQELPFTERLMPLALDECVRVYGKQKLDVTIKLIEQAADIVPFF
ncbi:hypothetical protein L7F22_026713 [Adiantum nelumboides]|nr:hypothetical protein [Adiantum nelumboides]